MTKYEVNPRAPVLCLSSTSFIHPSLLSCPDHSGFHVNSEHVARSSKREMTYINPNKTGAVTLENLRVLLKTLKQSFLFPVIPASDLVPSSLRTSLLKPDKYWTKHEISIPGFFSTKQPLLSVVDNIDKRRQLVEALLQVHPQRLLLFNRKHFFETNAYGIYGCIAPPYTYKWAETYQK